MTRHLGGLRQFHPPQPHLAVYREAFLPVLFPVVRGYFSHNSRFAEAVLQRGDASTRSSADACLAATSAPDREESLFVDDCRAVLIFV